MRFLSNIHTKNTIFCTHTQQWHSAKSYKKTPLHEINIFKKFNFSSIKYLAKNVQNPWHIKSFRFWKKCIKPLSTTLHILFKINKCSINTGNSANLTEIITNKLSHYSQQLNFSQSFCIIQEKLNIQLTRGSTVPVAHALLWWKGKRIDDGVRLPRFLI